MIKDVIVEIDDMIFEGQVEYEEKDASFDHEFGTEKRTEIVVNELVGWVTFTEDDGEILATININDCSEYCKNRFYNKVSCEL